MRQTLFLLSVQYQFCLVHRHEFSRVCVDKFMSQVRGRRVMTERYKQEENYFSIIQRHTSFTAFYAVHAMHPRSTQYQIRLSLKVSLKHIVKAYHAVLG